MQSTAGLFNPSGSIRFLCAILDWPTSFCNFSLQCLHPITLRCYIPIVLLTTKAIYTSFLYMNGSWRTQCSAAEAWRGIKVITNQPISAYADGSFSASIFSYTSNGCSMYKKTFRTIQNNCLVYRKTFRTISHNCETYMKTFRIIPHNCSMYIKTFRTIPHNCVMYIETFRTIPHNHSVLCVNFYSVAPLVQTNV